MTDVYRPSRIERRRAAGSRCALCPNRMTHHDVLAVVQDERPPVYIHLECLSVAAEQAENAATAATEEEDSGTAVAEAESVDSTPSAKDTTDLDSGPYTSVASLHGGLA